MSFCNQIHHDNQSAIMLLGFPQKKVNVTRWFEMHISKGVIFSETFGGSALGFRGSGITDGSVWLKSLFREAWAEGEHGSKKAPCLLCVTKAKAFQSIKNYQMGVRSLSLALPLFLLWLHCKRSSTIPVPLYSHVRCRRACRASNPLSKSVCVCFERHVAF